MHEWMRLCMSDDALLSLVRLSVDSQCSAVNGGLMMGAKSVYIIQGVPANTAQLCNSATAR